MVFTMGGFFFGVVSREDCVLDVYFGTDYHSHIGTQPRAGLAFWSGSGFKRSIHNIENIQFAANKFDAEIPKIKGNMGIGHATIQ
jgi:amidophosphoribosyltransferase